MDTLAIRTGILETHGKNLTEVKALLADNHPWFDGLARSPNALIFPLATEFRLAVWPEYAVAAQSLEPFDALPNSPVQLRFPMRGMFKGHSRIPLRGHYRLKQNRHLVSVGVINY